MAQKVRLKKWVRYPLFILITVGLGYLAYLVALSIIYKPRDIRITNVTSGSATISWITDSPRTGIVVYKESKNFVPLFTGIGAEKAYDDRDWHDAQMECVNQLNVIAAESKDENFSVNGDNYDCNEFKIEKKGEYYVHHVALRGLDSEKTYHFRVGDSLLKWKAKDGDVFETYTPVSSVSEPIPIFGRVVSESGDYSDDSLVYIQFGKSGETMIESIMYSAVTNEDGGWYMDGGNIRGLDGEAYRLASGEDGVKFQGIYKNTEKSESENFVFGYFDGAYPDIETKSELMLSRSMLVQRAYANDKCSYEHMEVCTQEELDNHTEFGAGNIIKYSLALNQEAESPKSTAAVMTDLGYGNHITTNLAVATRYPRNEGNPTGEVTVTVDENGNATYDMHKDEFGNLTPYGADVSGGVDSCPSDCDLEASRCVSGKCVPLGAKGSGGTSAFSMTFDENLDEVWTFSGKVIDPVDHDWLFSEVQTKITTAKDNCKSRRAGNNSVECDDITIEFIAFEDISSLIQSSEPVHKCFVNKDDCGDNPDFRTQIVNTLYIQRETQTDNAEKLKEIDSLIKASGLTPIRFGAEGIEGTSYRISDEDPSMAIVDSNILTTNLLTKYWESLSNWTERETFLASILALQDRTYVTTAQDHTDVILGFEVDSNGDVYIISSNDSIVNGNTPIIFASKPLEITIPIDALPKSSDYQQTKATIAGVESIDVVKITPELLTNDQVLEIWNNGTKSDKITLLSNFLSEDELEEVVGNWGTDAKKMYICGVTMSSPTCWPGELYIQDSHFDTKISLDDLTSNKFVINQGQYEDNDTAFLLPTSSLDKPQEVVVISKEDYEQIKDELPSLKTTDPVYLALNKYNNSDNHSVNCQSTGGCSLELLKAALAESDLVLGDEYMLVKVSDNYRVVMKPDSSEKAIESLNDSTESINNLFEEVPDLNDIIVPNGSERSSLFNFRDLLSKSYAQEATSQELTSSKDAGYTFFLPEYGMYSLTFGSHEFKKDVSDGENIYIFYLDVNGQEGFQPPVDPDNPTAYEDMVLKSDAFKIEYEQIASVREYDFKPGINIISFDFIPVSERRCMCWS